MRVPIPFIFGVHAHQPVGNFDYIIEQAYEDCYRPFLETLLRFPSVKSTWHLSGPLLEFLSARHPQYVSALRSLVDEGRAEILASGWYEPILAALPPVDRREQVSRFQDYLQAQFGARPQGLWLTERVWEPEIVEDLIACGIRYVFVDDYHFLSAGFAPEQLHGYFVTEAGGETLGVFPIDERLRYLTPFQNEEETMAYLQRLETVAEAPAAVIVDDLEKFGSWPGTHDWVYRRRWLERFLEMVSSSDTVEWTLPREYLASVRPRGLAYLPTASYFEMGEWTLPAERARDFHRMIEEWKTKPEWEVIRPFLRGSIWKNFLVKYPEANYLHKKMLKVSRQVNAAADSGARESARSHLFRGQCNDAYWHGVFGGLYLPHLRRANYRHLLEAESLCDSGEPTVIHRDIDADGAPEIYATNQDWVVCIAPHKGGGLRELSARSLLHNFCDTLSRRREHYHPVGGTQEGDASNPGEEQNNASIHDLQKSVPAKVRRRMAYDAYERVSFVDHFLSPSTGLRDFRLARHHEVLDLITAEYTVERLVQDQASLICSSRGTGGYGVTLSKEYRWNVGPGRFEVHYRAESEFPAEETLLFAPEMTFAFPAAGSEPGSVRHAGKVFGGFGEDLEIGGQRVTARDEVGGFELMIEAPGAERIWIFPVLTLSQSEGGFDEIYQGSSLTPLFRFSPDPGTPFHCRITLELKLLAS